MNDEAWSYRDELQRARRQLERILMTNDLHTAKKIAEIALDGLPEEEPVCGICGRVYEDCSCVEDKRR